MNRRAFLKAAVAAGFSPWLAPGALATDAILDPRPTTQDARIGTRDAMFVSLNSSLTRRMEWLDFARLAGTTGYGGVDVDLASAQKQGGPATRMLLNSLRLSPGSINLPVTFSGDDPTYQSGLARLEDAAMFAAIIGCPRMVAVLPPSSATPKAEFRALLKSRLTAIAKILQSADVRLGLEFLGPLHFRTRQPHEFIWRMPEALEFSAECGANVGLLLDAWHWHHAGASAGDIVAAGKSRIVHIHVSDAKAQPPEEVRDNQRLMPGEGVIDLVGFFQALKKIGYTDAVSPEPLGRVPADMTPEDGARLGLNTTVAVMKKAGAI
jgi:sugar phosphate isomerase/epimerase